jgi:hypothetical protein
MVCAKRINHNEKDVQGRLQPSIPATVKTVTDRGKTLAGPQASRKKPRVEPAIEAIGEYSLVGFQKGTERPPLLTLLQLLLSCPL